MTRAMEEAAAEERETYTFGIPPRAYKSPDSWAFVGSVLTKNGEPFADLARVTSATFGAHRVSAWFWLKTPDGNLAIDTNQLRVDDDSWRSYHQLIAAILERLGELHPSMLVNTPRGIIRNGVGFAFTGFLALTFGLGFVNRLDGGGASIPYLLLALLCIASCWVLRPWGRTRYKKPARDAAKAIRQSPPITPRSRNLGRASPL